MSSEPTPITRTVLDQRIESEVANLEGDDLVWWCAHRVEPFILPRPGRPPYAAYAVAVSGEITLIFFDSHDAFGRDAPERWEDDLILYGDLADAVRCLATRDSVSRLLVETTSGLLKSRVLERGDSLSKTRAIRILGAIGADAAAAVPQLIEIMTSDAPLGGLEETAVATLVDIGPGAAPAVPRLIEMAELDLKNARGWCLKAFESIGPAASPAVPLLIGLLRREVGVDPDPFYVPMAADALGNIGAIEALPALLETLRETGDPDIAIAVVRAIGKLGPSAGEAGPLLGALAADWPEADRFPENPDIRQCAREALHRIGRSGPASPPGPG